MKCRICSVILALSMVMALLSGCGGTGSAETTAAASTSPSETMQVSAAAENTPETAASASDVSSAVSSDEASAGEDSDGFQVDKYITPDNIEDLIAGRPGVSLPLSEDNATLTFWTGSPSMDATISNWDESTAAQEIEKQTGVDAQFTCVAPPTQSEALNLMFASGDFPDIINYALTGTYSSSYLIDNDIALDLSGMLKDDAPSYSALMDADPALYLATYDDEGRVAGLAGYQYNYFTTTGMQVRSDWLKKVGMTADDLKTVDGLHDFLAAVKNAGLCEYPMPLRYDAASSGSAILAAFGGRSGASDVSSANSFFYQDEGDNLVYSFTSDAYKAYLTEMAKWYQEGLITRDLLTSDMLDSSAIAQGQYAVLWQDCQFMDGWISAGQVNDPDFNLVGVEEPKMTEDQQIGFGDVPAIAINLVVTADCADPDLTLKWLDYHFSEDGSTLCQYGIEGEGLTYDSDGNPDYSELIKNNPDGLSMDNALNTYTVNINMYAKNGASLRTAYNEQQQKALDAWNGKRAVTKSSFLSQFTLSSDETNTIQVTYTDISTYVSTMLGKFHIGELDIDSEWDNFVDTVNSMGIDDVIKAYSSAGERYFGRIA